MIKCTKCKEQRLPDQFSPDQRNRSGRYSWCKPCMARKGREYKSRPEYKDQRKKYERKYYQVHHDEIRTKQIGARLLSRYGITKAQYDEMYESQEGRCLICGKMKAVLDVDHNHETGVVRGLLCRGCNVQLGILEKKEWVESAMAYLAGFK